MGLAGNTSSTEIPVSKAGVLKDFYRRTRRDGTVIYDIEWSLEQIERVVPPTLREIGTRWPLDPKEKALLAEFIGIQLVRGPRWRSWHLGATRKFVADALLLGGTKASRPRG